MKKNYNKIRKLLARDPSQDIPHSCNEIWGPNSMEGDRYYRVFGTLRDRRDYGEFCSDFIEENALELYLNGIPLGKLGEELKIRNPKEFQNIKCDDNFYSDMNKMKYASTRKKLPLSSYIRFLTSKIGVVYEYKKSFGDELAKKNCNFNKKGIKFFENVRQLS